MKPASVFTTLASAGVATAATSPLSCGSETQPNPIATQYPQDVTGVINGTNLLIPIPYATARSLVPSQYAILTAAYEQLIPSLPKGMYPLFFEGELDHDVQNAGVHIPDFQRADLRMPFVDRLGDGYSNFQYTLPIVISATEPVAVLGSAVYGETFLGDFDPYCQAYAGKSGGVTYSNAYVTPGGNDSLVESTPALAYSVAPKSGIPYSIEVFKNITNQPSFGNGLPVCDNYITLYNSSITNGAFAPVPVQGNLTVSGQPFYSSATTFSNVWGYKLAQAFIEHNSVPCSSLKGYSGTGSGD